MLHIYTHEKYMYKINLNKIEIFLDKNQQAMVMKSGTLQRTGAAASWRKMSLLWRWSPIPCSRFRWLLLRRKPYWMIMKVEIIQLEMIKMMKRGWRKRGQFFGTVGLEIVYCYGGITSSPSVFSKQRLSLFSYPCPPHIHEFYCSELGSLFIVLNASIKLSLTL